MSLVLRLYETDSATNKINKILSIKQAYQINLKNRPKDFNNLDIDYNYPTQQVIENVNYGYLVDYELYYFVTILPSNIGNNHNILHLTLDPLMTYRNEILGLSVITERNTNNYNVYLPDSEQKITSQYKQFYHTFKGGDIPYFTPHKSTLVTLVGSE